MRILLLHNRYQQTGGEDVMVDTEKHLLEQHGHEVRFLEVNNDKIQNACDKIRIAWNVTYSKTSREKVRIELERFRPDIVHVHNFFPLLTPSVYDACFDAGVPVVQTLHNYRPICPGALLMRNGNICEICVTHSAYHATRYGCYRRSKMGTLAVARMIETHRKRRTWQEKVNCFIALTEFARQKFIEADFPPEKIVIKPNCGVDLCISDSSDNTRNGALFVGRLSQEKGILTLLKAWQQVKNVPLRIAGDGPLLTQAQTMSSSNLTFLGWQPPEQVSREMREAAFLVMPSEGYEGFPNVLVEAFAHGLPIIASRLGAMAEIVENGVTGLHFEPGNADDLAAKVRWMQAHSDECRQMGQNARKEYLKKYTPERNYKMLMEIYKRALGD